MKNQTKPPKCSAVKTTLRYLRGHSRLWVHLDRSLFRGESSIPIGNVDVDFIHLRHPYRDLDILLTVKVERGSYFLGLYFYRCKAKFQKMSEMIGDICSVRVRTYRLVIGPSVLLV